MRNDARPIGRDAPHSPLGGPPSDARESAARDRQSHIVNRRAEDETRRRDADHDPAMRADDATLKTKI